MLWVESLVRHPKKATKRHLSIASLCLLMLRPAQASAELSIIGGSHWIGDILVSFKQAQPVLAGILSVSGLVLLSWIAFKTVRSKRQRQPPGILERLPDAIALFDAKGQLTAINTKLLKLLPLETSADELENITTSDLYAQLSPDNIAIERARNDARNHLHDPDSTISFEVPSYGPKSLLVKERPTDDGGTAITVYGAQRPHGTRLSDPLTALPNRTRLLNELAQRCSRTKDELALIIVDLRSFRQINDSYGREAGDELLKQTGICLQHCMADDALIARTAGDEFAVLIEFDNDGRIDIERCVTRFLTTLRHGLNVKAMNVPARASVGIAFAPEHGNTVSKLLECADSACAHAKQLGNNTLVVYNSEQQHAAKRRHKMEIGLQQAIKNNELSLQYQPQVDIATMMTSGTEALLRWKSPEHGQVSPAEFIYVAEQSGIITQLGIWVLNQAIEDYQGLARYGMAPEMLSVNLSRKQFENGRIVEDVARVLDTTGFDPSRLCLEITETALFRDSESMHKILHDLTALGTNIAIDDFGVGYSSLLELRDYPISEVKIDRAFVMDVATSQSSRDIIKAIVDIAKSIGAEVVAEGIEDQQQFDMVKKLGCHRAQGYFLCKPMPVTTFPDVLLGA
ncbi:MAG: EAL domain-containing protein [Granulosicoccaceae bacterium]